jgi:hypothetical protein
VSDFLGDAIPGQQLNDAEEFLWRQVHPDWMQAGRPTSQAFKPTPKDQGLMSVSQSSLVSAEDAFQFHISTLDLESAGVWAITVSDASSVGYAVFDDSQNPVPNTPPGHALVDTSHESRSRQKSLARALASAANDRGRIHP